MRAQVSGKISSYCVSYVTDLQNGRSDSSSAQVSLLFSGKTYQLVGNKNRSKASFIFSKIRYFM